MRKLLVLALLIFFSSALIGAWISYNPSGAFIRLTLVLVGLGLFGILFLLPAPNHNDRIALVLRWGFAIAPIFIIVYFVLTNDWTYRLGKVSWLDPLLIVLARWNLGLPGYRLDSNAFGGIIAALLPLELAAFLSKGKKIFWLGFIFLIVSGAGLLLSESRGAWIALALVCGIVCGWILIGIVACRRYPERSREWQLRLTSLLALVILSSVLIVTVTPLGQRLLQQRSDRLDVWQNSLALVSDYPITGLGLGGFDMAYSSYVILVHVSHTLHAHNLYLDIWLEQGIAGLIAFTAIVVLSIVRLLQAFLRGATISKWQVAALASLGVVLLHGWTDDPFYGYGGKAIPFLFLPLGLLAQRSNVPISFTLRFKSNIGRIAGASGAIVLLAVIGFSVRAAIVANLGALAQTQTELSVYDWRTWEIQDALRRSPKIDLSPAIAHYKSALMIDSRNATANRRLGQIELSRGNYDSARNYLESAYAAAPDQRATRQLLGEVYAMAGNTDRAVALWQPIDVSDGQLQYRIWWYEHLGDMERAKNLKLAAQRLGK